MAGQWDGWMYEACVERMLLFQLNGTLTGWCRQFFTNLTICIPDLYRKKGFNADFRWRPRPEIRHTDGKRMLLTVGFFPSSDLKCARNAFRFNFWLFFDFAIVCVMSIVYVE